MRLINEIQDNFTMIPNYILLQKNISLKAIGLYCKLSSLPNDWRFTESGLFSIVKDGKDSTKSALKELEDLGLFYKFQSRDKSGKAGEVVFYISPVPMTEERKLEIRDRFCPMEIIKVTESIDNTEFQPSAGNPLSEKPLSENQRQYNTNIYNINEYNIKKEKIYKKEKDFDIYQEEFEKLWKLYPRKEGKRVAEKVYLNLRKKNEVTYEEVEKGILAYIQDLKKNRTQEKFILHGSTYFNQRRWEDELPEVETKTEKLVTEEEQDFLDRFE